jgi:hypothetical protein
MKEWTTKTVLHQLSEKILDAVGEDIMDPDSPARDETVGDMIDMLIRYDYGMPVEIPGQTKIEVEDVKVCEK